ncbi:DUF3826 domain-containing protein [Flavobacterium cellulosilyticum]|uniref:DUF3826 domain-containing protein n=1 Tax=Flavobacterium cellulosilyticum TaxID=2541731 RepID=A0A4R5CK61_9FLAO|nr:DUF3826 domain-containing protein [Flavobacterium cellulosilyticum]TDD97804.1 DUF3826 domain-containing protein [Flavobacterium cellulosilyticum]
MSIKKLSLSLLLFVFALCKISAQQYIDPEYIKVTNERAAKIVAELKLSDSEKENAVTNIIAQQYRDLSQIQDERDLKIEEVKSGTLSKEKKNKKIDKLKTKADRSIGKLHKSYLKKLGSQLNDEKITAVKDGMTYGVVEITYTGYQDMLPNLTPAQKKYIYDNLVEARELAMDGGTSKEKHAWFGKYKGRINNYLSAQGYDLNKESTDWHKRLEEREKNKSKE